MTSETDTGRALCSLLDLERKELSGVKELVEREDFDGALVAFRDRFVDLASTFDPGELPGFWLWTATDARDLLDTGVVATAQYGEFDKTSRYVLGPPGAADWNKIPDDGYDVVLRDLATMHWTSRLLEAYQGDLDPAYLRTYLGYWHDFAQNWLSAHREIRQKGIMIERDQQPHVKRSIPWASESKLYFAWRLDNLFSWLPTAIARSPDQAKENIDPTQLATLILHVVEFEIPGSLRGLEAVGTPNQFVHCALGLLKTSLALQDLRDGPGWTETAIERMNWYAESGGYLADGSDMEQSFNYNPGLIHSLESVLHLARTNPPLNKQEHIWARRFKEMRDYRERFLDSLTMPDGRRPATGCDNTWNYSRAAAVSEYANEQMETPDSEQSLTLGKAIRSHLLGGATLPAPGFDSIYFPYGGWVALRDGWTPKSLYSFMKTSRPAPGHMREGGNGLAMAAYGRYLVVNSGDDAYSDRGVYSRYFESTVSQSSISVDGYSQVLNATGKNTRYDLPIPARWHTSSHFDFCEGIYESSYGGWNFRTDSISEPISDDVRHVRQLLFLRQVGVWIVTDRLTSTRRHEYSQSWCLGPGFAADEVVVDQNTDICTTQSNSGANIAFQFFSSSPLALSTHYGENDGITALGWRAVDWNEEQQSYTPAVDLLTEFSGEGDQIIVALLVPFKSRSNRVVTCRSLNNGDIVGFEAKLADGSQLIYQTSKSDTFTAEDMEVDGQALLVTTSRAGERRGVVLDEDDTTGYEFHFSGSGEIRTVHEFGVPTGFEWAGAEESVVPVTTNT
jgi:hypothetical protein